MAKSFAHLRKKMPQERQARAKARADAILASMPLQELRRARELSQQTLAKAMETTQSEISKLEHRTDAHISTLRSYVEAMHGRLRIVSEFSGGGYENTQLEEIDGVSSR